METDKISWDNHLQHPPTMPAWHSRGSHGIPASSMTAEHSCANHERGSEHPSLWAELVALFSPAVNDGGTNRYIHYRSPSLSFILFLLLSTLPPCLSLALFVMYLNNRLVRSKKEMNIAINLTHVRAIRAWICSHRSGRESNKFVLLSCESSLFISISYKEVCTVNKI